MTVTDNTPETAQPTNEPSTAPKDAEKKPPESVRLMLLLFGIAVGGEIIHQILTVVISLTDPSALIATAKEGMDNEQIEQLGEGAIRAAAYSSVILMGVLGLAIMGVLVWMLVSLKNRGKFAGAARRMLLVFGFYFGFRILLLFMVTSSGSDVPVALYVVDGILQIITGVAAVLGLIFAFREDSLKWTRELPSPKDRT